MALIDPPASVSPDAALVHRPRPLSLRRATNAVLGGLSGGAAAWVTVWLAEPGDFPARWFIAGLALLGAGLGYRYGRHVVRATWDAFCEAFD